MKKDPILTSNLSMLVLKNDKDEVLFYGSEPYVNLLEAYSVDLKGISACLSLTL